VAAVEFPELIPTRVLGRVTPEEVRAALGGAASEESILHASAMIEEILQNTDIDPFTVRPATRLMYFLSAAAEDVSGGGQREDGGIVAKCPEHELIRLAREKHGDAFAQLVLTKKRDLNGEAATPAQVSRCPV
jgi:hypothetical protein